MDDNGFLSVSDINLERLNALIKDGAITEERLMGWMDNMDKRHQNREKKKERQIINGQGKNFHFPVAIDYASSVEIYGAEMMPPERKNSYQDLSFNSKSPLAKKELNWELAWLNGCSIKEMMEKFPDDIIFRWPQRYDKLWFNDKSAAGYYLISWDNPFVNLPADSNLPDNCDYLEGNLLLEFLFTFKKIQKKLPTDAYLRSSFTDWHNKHFCLGLKDDKLHFKAFNGGKKHQKIVNCLVYLTRA